MGDKFEISENGEDKFDLIENEYPFNLNIACIGTFGQGKSTGVNEILNEYKAKESNKGSAQTKSLSLYHIENKPIRILDIPGFESEKTVKDAVEKFKKCGEEINKIKESIHIILYFLNYAKVKETRAISELEYPIIEEITKHKSSRIIYVITRSKQNLNEKNKKLFFSKINSGIQGITKNKPIQNEITMFKANENNVVFVNFKKDEDNPEIFGKKELFQKIKDFFIESDTYKESLESLNEEKLEETIEKLKATARYHLLPNKFWGGLAGMLPIADIAIQKFFIKKNAIKKAGQVFKIDLKFIDEENEKEKEIAKKKKVPNKIKEEKKIENEIKKEVTDIKIDGVNIINDYFNNQEEPKNEIKEEINKIDKDKKEPDYIKPGIDKEKLITTANGDELMKDSTNNNITKIVGDSIQLTSYTNGANNIVKFVQHSNKISDLMTQATILSNRYEIVDESINGLLDLGYWENEIAEQAYNNILDKIGALKKAGSGGKFFNFSGIGIFIGIGIGAYCTHNFCENLLNKFADYYRKNASKITNSYEEAIS